MQTFTTEAEALRALSQARNAFAAHPPFCPLCRESCHALDPCIAFYAGEIIERRQYASHNEFYIQPPSCKLFDAIEVIIDTIYGKE